MLRSLSERTCRSCENFIRTVEELSRSGQHLQGQLVRVTGAEAPPVEGQVASVEVFYEAPEQVYIGPDGSEASRRKAEGSGHLLVSLARATDRWTMAKIQFASDGAS